MSAADPTGACEAAREPARDPALDGTCLDEVDGACEPALDPARLRVVDGALDEVPSLGSGLCLMTASSGKVFLSSFNFDTIAKCDRNKERVALKDTLLQLDKSNEGISDRTYPCSDGMFLALLSYAAGGGPRLLLGGRCAVWPDGLRSLLAVTLDIHSETRLLPPLSEPWAEGFRLLLRLSDSWTDWRREWCLSLMIPSDSCFFSNNGRSYLKLCCRRRYERSSS